LANSQFVIFVFTQSLRLLASRSEC